MDSKTLVFCFVLSWFAGKNTAEDERLKICVVLNKLSLADSNYQRLRVIKFWYSVRILEDLE